jgi:hypothetical protein
VAKGIKQIQGVDYDEIIFARRNAKVYSDSSSYCPIL